MCNNCVDEIKIEDLVNIQTGKKIDMEKFNQLPDNAMLKVKPELWAEWDFEKNDGLGFDIWKMTKGTTKKPWWYCEKCDDSYDNPVCKKTIGRGCPYCAGYRVGKSNCLANRFPELAKEWHPTLNENLTPYDRTYGSGEKVWWICPKCGSDYDMRIDTRTSQNANCPFCRGLRVNETNSLASINPELAKHWNYDKNKNIAYNPDTIHHYSKEMVWWICPDCNNETYSAVRGKSGCAVCAGQKPKVGKTDMWTTKPELASLLLNPEDGYIYMQWSNQKVDWKCPCCGEIVKNKNISDINKNGFTCPICSDGLSFGERFMYILLKKLNVKFMYDRTQIWSENRRYDFFIPKQDTLDYEIIIEIQGEQHRNGSFSKIGGRNLCEEIENDRYKEQLANINGVNHYIRIDCDLWNFDLLKENTLNSELVTIFNIDESFINSLRMNINNNLTLETWKIWNSGNKSVMSISEILSLSKTTVRKYLLLGNSLGKCEYNVKNRYDFMKKKVVKLSIDGELIEIYESLADASRKHNAKGNGKITRALKDINKLAFNFKWMYFNDYESMINQRVKD